MVLTAAARLYNILVYEQSTLGAMAQTLVLSTTYRSAGLQSKLVCYNSYTVYTHPVCGTMRARGQLAMYRAAIC